MNATKVKLFSPPRARSRVYIGHFLFSVSLVIINGRFRISAGSTKDPFSTNAKRAFDGALPRVAVGGHSDIARKKRQGHRRVRRSIRAIEFCGRKQFGGTTFVQRKRSNTLSSAFRASECRPRVGVLDDGADCSCDCIRNSHCEVCVPSVDV